MVQELAMLNEGFGRAIIERQRLDEFLDRRRIEEQQLVVSYFRVLVKLVEEDKTDVMIRVIKRRRYNFC